MEPAIIIISAQARRGDATTRRDAAATDGKWSHEIEHRNDVANDVGNDVGNANAKANAKWQLSCQAADIFSIKGLHECVSESEYWDRTGPGTQPREQLDFCGSLSTRKAFVLLKNYLSCTEVNTAHLLSTFFPSFE